MRDRWSLKKQNKGASLLAVLIAFIFVGIIAAIILDITITNIRMREIEQSGKKNFYSAETVMDELTVGLNAKAAEAMQSAYTQILSDYQAIMLSGSNIQEKFTRLYMENLKAQFWDSGATQVKTDSGGNETYVIGSYRTDVLKDCITTPEYRPCVVTEAADASFDVDYTNGLLTLKNVKVRYTDARDYETTISTDIVFHTPVLNFKNDNMVKEFMRYSLIADDQIRVDAGLVSVDGSAYAGVGGILCTGSGSSGTFTGNTLVTRGDIVTESGTQLTVGTAGTTDTKIWAENIRTSGEGAPSYMYLNGNCYIADDLTMSGDDSTVQLTGRYYGYNYQDNYTAVRDDARGDAAFNSAVMLNGRNCRLNMEGLDYLLLSGKTFISRGSAGNTQNSDDIMLGESVSARTSQLVCYVPSYCLDTDDPAHAVFTAEGEAEYEKLTGVEDVMDYLDAAEPVTVYYYRDNGVPAMRYYLNFASDQKANDFFTAYYAENMFQSSGKADNYVTADALVIDGGLLCTLKGDILYRDSAGEDLKSKSVTINASDWDPGATEADNGVYWDFAGGLARSYMSLQMELDPSGDDVAASDVRFVDPADPTGETINKEITPLFDNLIDKAALKNEVTEADKVHVVSEEPLAVAGKRVVVLVDNDTPGAFVDSVYRIPPEYREGIIIATGDVMVQGTFTGTIISGGTITFASGASVSADELMVSGLFSDHADLFEKFIRDYDTFSESVIGTVQIEDYLTYDNWKKNGD